MYERYMICRMFGAEVHLLNPVAGATAWLKYTEEVPPAQNCDSPASCLPPHPSFDLG